MEFLEQRPQDDQWQEACLEWLEEWAQPAASTTATSQAPESEAAIAAPALCGDRRAVRDRRTAVACL